ncbi:TPA: hypothetical protein ACMDTL_003534, partial [Vibrio cholerae]
LKTANILTELFKQLKNNKRKVNRDSHLNTYTYTCEINIINKKSSIKTKKCNRFYQVKIFFE